MRERQTHPLIFPQRIYPWQQNQLTSLNNDTKSFFLLRYVYVSSQESGSRLWKLNQPVIFVENRPYRIDRIRNRVRENVTVLFQRSDFFDADLSNEIDSRRILIASEILIPVYKRATYNQDE